MKRIFILGISLLVISGIVFGLYLNPDVAASIKMQIFGGDEPDIPDFAKYKVDKQDFMMRRSEGIAMFRGIHKDQPLPDPQDRVRAIQEMERQEADLADSLVPQAAWVEIGPAPIPNGQVDNGPQLPVSGRTVSIAVHPTNPNLVYVGTAQGGLYRTLDGGTTWTTMLDSALSLAVNTVVIAPSQPDTIFVGTGESGFSGDSFFGAGIYRIDNASTVAPTLVGPIGGNNFLGRSIGKIVVHPTNANIIFAGSTSGIGGLRAVSNNVLAVRGLFRSTDALSAAPTFTKLTLTGVAAQDRNVLDIVMDPGNPNLVLCTVADSFNLGEGGVYRSIDALVAAPTFVRTFTAGVGTDASRTELALNRNAQTNVVTVYAASGFMGGTVQRSIDGGATFAQRIDNNFCSSQCFYDIAVAVDPVNADTVYLGGSPTLVFGRSTDGGTTFTNNATTASGLHVDSHTIGVAPSLPTTIYFGSDGGIYKSINSGTTWVSLNNTTFRATQFTGLAVHPIDPNFTIGGTQDNGTNFYRPDATWFRADFGDGGYAVIDQSALNNVVVNMYHTYFNAGTLKGYGFTNNGVNPTEGTWLFRGCNGVAGNGIPCGGSVLFYAPLEQGPGTPNTIYYGADTLYRSADTGLNHTAVSQNFGTSPISAIGISPQNDNVRIVGLTGSGTTPGGLFGTTAGAAVLTDLDAGGAIPNVAINRTVIDPLNQNTAYVTLSAFGLAANVFKTTNLNNAAPTWTPSSTGLPAVPVNGFIVDPIDSNRLYAGTDIGVYTSGDSGANWIPFGTGLPRVAVFDLAMTPGTTATRLVRIATHGRGMWQIPALAPLAASVSVSGRVTNSEGRSVARAVVTLIDSQGNSRQTLSSSFGYYRFDEVEVGQTYTFTVTAKRYEFQSQVITVNEEIENLNFAADN